MGRKVASWWQSDDPTGEMDVASFGQAMKLGMTTTVAHLGEAGFKGWRL